MDNAEGLGEAEQDSGIPRTEISYNSFAIPRNRPFSKIGHILMSSDSPHCQLMSCAPKPFVSDSDRNGKGRARGVGVGVGGGGGRRQKASSVQIGCRDLLFDCSPSAHNPFR